MNKESVEQHTRRLRTMWKAGPSIDVVGTAGQLPFPAPDDVRGAYLPSEKRAWIVAEEHLARAVSATVAHEVVAHHAVREMLSRRAWQSLMGAIQGGASKDERIEMTRNFVRAVYVDHDGSAYLPRVLESDEVLAAFAEALIDHRSGRIVSRHPVRSILAAFTGQIKRETLLLDRAASFEEIEGVLLMAERRLRTGAAFWGVARKCYSRAMEKPCGPARPARSLAESEQMLRDANSHLEWLGELKFVGAIIFLFASVPLTLWLYGTAFVDVFHAILGR